MMDLIQRSKPGLEILALVSAVVLIGVPVAFTITAATDHIIGWVMTWWL